MPKQLSPAPATMDRDRFVATFGHVYEHSPWVAERLFDQGLSEAHNDVDHLAQSMASVVASAEHDLQMALVLAHPDLAGKAAVSGELTPDSTDEQASAGLDQCNAEEFERFQSLNEAYRTKFRFPFIMAVKNSNRHKILAAFETRLPNDPDTEFSTALMEINKIARIRLQTIADAA